MICRAALLATLACSAAATACQPTGPSAPLAGEWQVVFEDDFSGSALNTSSWTASNYSSIVSQYDGHDAMFIADRVTVSGGALVLTTVYDPRTLDGVSYNFTSGWVDSQHKRNMTRGRFEASMRMPVENATGAWPAWWLLPEGACWPVGTEIDIVEYYVGEGHNQHSRPNNPAQMSSSYHYGYSCGNDKYSYPVDTVWWPSGNWTPNAPIIDFSADFHVFGAEINDTAVRFYVDDPMNTIFTKVLPQLCVSDPSFQASGGWGNSPYMPWAPMYGILNVAMNKGDANLEWWSANNATTLVDWVKFFEFVPTAAEAALPALAAAALA